MEGLDRIAHDLSVMGGRACIREMRVTVSLVLGAEGRLVVRRLVLSL